MQLEENMEESIFGDNSTIGVSEVSLLPEALDILAKSHEQRLESRRISECLSREQESQEQHHERLRNRSRCLRRQQESQETV